MNIPQATRAYIYRVLLTLQPLAVGYGLISEQQAVLWVSVASAVLGLGLAVANTPKSPDLPPVDPAARNMHPD